MVEQKLPFAHCDKCPYAGRKLVHGCGPEASAAKLVIVGESPGVNETRWGVPFVGKSGVLLRTLLRYAGFNEPTCRDIIETLKTGDTPPMGDVYYTNAAACLPPPGDAEQYKTSDDKKQAALRCNDRLNYELTQYIAQGVPICGLGGGASLALVGNEGITKIRGQWHKTKKWGMVLTTWHPAYILRQPSRMSELVIDLNKTPVGHPTYWDHTSPQVLLLDTDDKMSTFTDELLRMLETGRIQDDTIAFDIEADNINFQRDRILCIQISWNVDGGAVIAEDIIWSENTKECLARLFDGGFKWVGHNAKFDVKFIRYQLGVANAHFEYDSLLGDYALDENRMHGLKELLANYYSLPDYEQEFVMPYLKSKNDMYSKVPRPMLYWYGVYDTAYTLRLWRDARTQLEAEGLWEHPFMSPLMSTQPMLIDMEMYGMLVDRDQMDHLSGLLRQHLENLRQELVERAFPAAAEDLNCNSPKQVSLIMYEHFNMPKQKIRGLKPTTTAKAARQSIMRHYRESGEIDCDAAQWLAIYGEWKSIEKIRSSYVDNIIPRIDKRGRVHPDILAYGTETGRLSVRKPALQTIPRKGTAKALGTEWGREIKLCFIAPEGYKLAQVDYSQAELRTGAWMSQDPFLIECYREGRDIHGEVAEAFFPGYHDMEPDDRMETAIGPKSKSDLRKEVKKCVFGRFYLGTAYTIMETLNCTMVDAKAYLAIIDSLLGGLVVFEDRQWEQMKTEGHVETLTGRRRRVPLITRQNQDDARKAACNAPVQGTASDLTLEAAYRVWQWFNDPDVDITLKIMDTHYHLTHEKLKDCHVLITVHDSVILEIPEDIVVPICVWTKWIMETIGDEWMPGIPWVADIEVGNSWGELKEVNWDIPSKNLEILRPGG